MTTKITDRVGELAEHIADLAGVYGVPDEDDENHSEKCPCRMCFVSDISQRVREVAQYISTERGGSSSH